MQASPTTVEPSPLKRRLSFGSKKKLLQDSFRLVRRSSKLSVSSSNPLEFVKYEDKYQFDDEGNIKDTMRDLVDPDDFFLTAAKFGKIKNEKVEESVLVFGKLNVYRIIRDPNDTKTKLSSLDQALEEETIQQAHSRRVQEKIEEEIYCGLMEIHHGTSPNIDEDILLQTNFIAPIDALSFRQNWIVKWKAPWCLIHSIQRCLHPTMFTITFHKDITSQYGTKQYMCNNTLERDLWFSVINNFLHEYSQEYFESKFPHVSIIHFPCKHFLSQNPMCISITVLWLNTNHKRELWFSQTRKLSMSRWSLVRLTKRNSKLE